VETLSTSSEMITISGEAYPAALVRQRFMQINSLHIECIFSCLEKSGSDIRNIKRYLREHRHRLYSTMLLGGRLDDHLHEIDDAAQRRMDQLTRQMEETAWITEELKARDPMRWVGEMNAIKAQAKEMILEELIYS